MNYYERDVLLKGVFFLKKKTTTILKEMQSDSSTASTSTANIRNAFDPRLTDDNDDDILKQLDPNDVVQVQSVQQIEENVSQQLERDLSTATYGIENDFSKT